MSHLPKARTDNIVVQNLPAEILIYDLSTDKAFCLNETAAKIFNRCDGQTSFGELKREYRLTDEIIYLALDGLQRQNLLAGEYVSPFAGMNRRETIKRVGLASIIALPAISVLVAPAAANAASTVCSNSGATCVSSPADCTRAAFLGTCNTFVQSSTTGFCSSNPPSGNYVTCYCCRTQPKP